VKLDSTFTAVIFNSALAMFFLTIGNSGLSVKTGGRAFGSEGLFLPQSQNSFSYYTSLFLVYEINSLQNNMELAAAEITFSPSESTFSLSESAFSLSESTFSLSESTFSLSESTFSPSESTFSPSESTFSEPKTTFSLRKFSLLININALNYKYLKT